MEISSTIFWVCKTLIKAPLCLDHFSCPSYEACLAVKYGEVYVGLILDEQVSKSFNQIRRFSSSLSFLTQRIMKLSQQSWISSQSIVSDYQTILARLVKFGNAIIEGD